MKTIFVRSAANKWRLSRLSRLLSGRYIGPMIALGLGTTTARAQINTGSDGHDGALNPTSDLVINMADHSDGIYQYSSVSIPAGVTVTFIPNANNTPVVWLVQNSVRIDGTVDVSGQDASGNVGGNGGPGGWAGGMGRGHGAISSSGQGPGGGLTTQAAGSAYADGGQFVGSTKFLIPLIGGSGGAGGGPMRGDPWGDGGGGGGGGAILIATSGTITVNGSVLSEGGLGSGSGAGSGGGIRFIASEIEGAGSVNTGGKNPYWSNGGDGVIRLDTYTSAFSGAISGLVTQGFQPIIIPAPNQAAQLAIASVAGVAVAASPSGALSNPDVVVPGQQANPVPIVVQCTNIALNTAITVNVTPMNGAPVSVTGFNTTGTLASSSATVFLNLPRGGGLIYAQATTGLLVGSTEPTPSAKLRAASYAQTGLTTSGERFTKIEITAALGGKQRIAYLTESGKRYTLQSAGL